MKCSNPNAWPIQQKESQALSQNPSQLLKYTEAKGHGKETTTTTLLNRHNT